MGSREVKVEKVLVEYMDEPWLSKELMDIVARAPDQQQVKVYMKSE